MARFLFIFALMMILSSCSDLFSTRDPEDPDGDTDNYLNESVLELKTNFKTSLLALDAELYESLFLNSVSYEYKYTFASEASDISQPGIFTDWDIESEKKFLRGLKAEGLFFSDIELSSDPVDETADSLDFNIDYAITVTDSTGSFNIGGNFIFSLIKLDGHFWYIKKWTDISPAGSISFSKLKEPYAY
ncbi:MAG TPA: hypothetical protein PLK90_09370 [Clostridiales bacterium]|nr:hypothetical protein [Clostridiales bacterium]HQP70596.1 hypothetical protein [Clostridiales bacterium]